MGIPDTQLESWSHQGSITQSKNTYAAIKGSLESTDTNYVGKDFGVFLQGSYGNDTNIYAESDVDVVIRLDATFYHDTSALTPDEQALFNGAFSPASYPYASYKADVITALVTSFGADVKFSENAIKVKASGSRRSADVLVATEFRRYLSGYSPLQYTSGVFFFTSGGDRIVNYPKQHSANCTKKHQATNEWFKPMVRILKNMRSKLVENEAISEGSAPSYFLEGLLYNVPNDQFGTSYGDTFVAAMNWIRKADLSTFVCANEQYYLARDSAAECWQRADCGGFINAVVDLWNNWP